MIGFIRIVIYFMCMIIGYFPTKEVCGLFALLNGSFSLSLIVCCGGFFFFFPRTKFSQAIIRISPFLVLTILKYFYEEVAYVVVCLYQGNISVLIIKKEGR